MKRVLIISKTFFPEKSPRANRTTELAREFVRRGDEVTVYIPDLELYELSRFPDLSGINFKSLGRLRSRKISGTKIFGRVVGRVGQMLIEYPDVQLVNMIRHALKDEIGYDLLISIAVPHPIHWGVNLAVRENKNLCKFWAADCGDPYMGCRTDTFNKLFYFKYIEKSWCAKCERIIVPHEAMQSDFYPEFSHKICVIPQGFNMDDYSFLAYEKNEVPTFAFAGGLSEKYRNPIPFMEHLAGVDSDFKFIVYTESKILHPYKSLLGNKLEIRSYIPRMELLPALSQMDFLVNFENASIQKSLDTTDTKAETNYSRPSKLIDYGIVKRPILSINQELDTTAISEFLRGNYEKQYVMDDMNRFDIKSVVDQFVNLTME